LSLCCHGVGQFFKVSFLTSCVHHLNKVARESNVIILISIYIVLCLQTEFLQRSIWKNLNVEDAVLLVNYPREQL